MHRMKAEWFQALADKKDCKLFELVCWFPFFLTDYLRSMITYLWLYLLHSAYSMRMKQTRCFFVLNYFGRSRFRKIEFIKRSEGLQLYLLSFAYGTFCEPLCHTNA